MSIQTIPRLDCFHGASLMQFLLIYMYIILGFKLSCLRVGLCFTCIVVKFVCDDVEDNDDMNHISTCDVGCQRAEITCIV